MEEKKFFVEMDADCFVNINGDSVPVKTGDRLAVNEKTFKDITIMSPRAHEVKSLKKKSTPKTASDVQGDAGPQADNKEKDVAAKTTKRGQKASKK